jgi:hypothetical protein
VIDPIEKARKLLQLRDRAATPGEAQAAARALALMLDKHRITVAELEMRDGEHGEPMAADESNPLLTFTRMPRWRSQLIAVLCRHYGVAAWQKSAYIGRSMRGRRKLQHAIHLCGRASDVDMVRHMFSWLSAEAERLAHQECVGHGAVVYNSWRSGFVVGIDTQLCSVREAVTEHHTEAALVLQSRHQQAAEHLASCVKILETTTHYRFLHSEAAHAAGKKRGESQHLGDRLDAGVCRALPEQA